MSKPRTGSSSDNFILKPSSWAPLSYSSFDKYSHSSLFKESSFERIGFIFNIFLQTQGFLFESSLLSFWLSYQPLIMSPPPSLFVPDDWCSGVMAKPCFLGVQSTGDWTVPVSMMFLIGSAHQASWNHNFLGRSLILSHPPCAEWFPTWFN